MPTVFCDVFLDRKKIDTVSQSFNKNEKLTKKEIEDYVYESLVNHDGYGSDIKVKCVTPLTRLSYRLYVNYGNGFEFEVEENSMPELRAQQKCYRENCPQYQTKTKIQRVSIFS